jgi:hypothetical protein
VTKPKSITYQMILDADDKGWTVQQIAAHYQMNERTVQKACQNYNVILKSQKKHKVKRQDDSVAKRLTFSCSMKAIQSFEEKLRETKVVRV